MSSNGPRISPLLFEYKCPRLSLLIIKSISDNQQNRNDFLLYYSMHTYSGVIACFEHSIFVKVNLPASLDTRLRAHRHLWNNYGLQGSNTSKQTALSPPKSKYKLFNHNNKYTPLELELPQLLAPDLPSNRSLGTVLKCTYSDCRASDESWIIICCHYLYPRYYQKYLLTIQYIKCDLLSHSRFHHSEACTWTCMA